MTKNKFGVITNWCIYENVDGIKKWLNFDEVVNLLNALNDENEQLKQYAQTSKEFTKYVEDFFKKHDFDTVNFDALDEMIDTDNFFYEKSLKLEKENEQLKQSEQEFKEYCNYLKSILEDNEILYD